MSTNLGEVFRKAMAESQGVTHREPEVTHREPEVTHREPEVESKEDTGDAQTTEVEAKAVKDTQTQVSEIADLIAGKTEEVPEDETEEEEALEEETEEYEAELPLAAQPTAADVMSQAAEAIVAARQELNAAYSSPEFAQMQREDPGQAALILQRMQARGQEIEQAEQALLGTQQQQQQHQVSQYVQREFEKVTTGPESTRIKGWDNWATRQKEYTVIQNKLRENGYSDQEILLLGARDLKTFHSLIFKKRPPKQPRREFKTVNPKPLKKAEPPRKPRSTVESVSNILAERGIVR